MAVLPRLIRPMLATLRRGLPADQDRYGWEFKWDGVRAIAYVSGGEVRLVSRNDKEMAASYPELAVLAGRAGAPVILDGEIVALRGGRPDFGALQSRMHVRRPPARLTGETPVQLYLFDLLHHGPDSLLGLPCTGRRDRLEELGLDADPVRTPPWYRDDAELLGVYDNDRLRYAGNVGTGFTAAMLTDLLRQLGPLERETSPFGTTVPPRYARGAHWAEPRLAGEVAFTQWTADGSMRHPSWRGLRPDKNPGAVHREALTSPAPRGPCRPGLGPAPGTASTRPRWQGRTAATGTGEHPPPRALATHQHRTKLNGEKPGNCLMRRPRAAGAPRPRGRPGRRPAP